MGVEIKLTDKEFPVSPVFIDFLHRAIGELPWDATWYDQVSEELVPADADLQKKATGVAGQVLDSPLGQQAIFRSYQLLTALITGQPERLRLFHERYKFICVVGCPRHGGTYLTKELYRAIGMDPGEVPNAIAHDGFPDSAPFELREGLNSHTTMTQHMAEYLAMVEVFFANSRLFNNRVLVPKKATKAAYNGAFFATVLGPETEFIVTLRHPVAACISTYEKSNGLPPDGRFQVRGNIEEWARRDNILAGEDPRRLMEMEYFDAYLRYWELYHHGLALTGLARSRSLTVVAYGRDRLVNLARSLGSRLRAKGEPGQFVVRSDYRGRHPQWEAKAVPAIARVAGVWRTVGMSFPVDEVMECQ
jgi:hypothetical protein